MIPQSIHKTIFEALRSAIQVNRNKVIEIGKPHHSWRGTELNHLNETIRKQEIAIKWLLENKPEQ